MTIFQRISHKYIQVMAVAFTFKVQLVLSILAGALVLSSCRQLDVFEKNVTIPTGKWVGNFKAKGTFLISDTVSAYNIYIVLRHTDSYNYNNIWLNVGLQRPGDSIYFQKLNLSLGNDAAWDGTGMNDIWEVRKLINSRPQRFKKMGQYSFSISQIMRDDPLPGILNAGLRVEKQR